MNLVQELSKEQMKASENIPQFSVGDTVRVHFRIVEGEKERIQVFEGVVIARKQAESPNATFTVRRVAYGEGVERVFPLHSPRVEKVEVTREGSVRRAKLYYLRDRVGKASRVKAKMRDTSDTAKAAAREAKIAARAAAREAKAAAAAAAAAPQPEPEAPVEAPAEAAAEAPATEEKSAE